MKPYTPIATPVPSYPSDWTWDGAFSPAYIQPKLNGVRAMLSPDGRIFKKSSDECRPLKGKFGAPEHWIDGELWHPEMSLAEIAGLVNRGELDEEVSRLQFWAFDLIHPDIPQDQRFDSLLLISQLNKNRFNLVETIYSEDPLYSKRKFYEWNADKSYDGMIYRMPAAKYQFGRTRCILKRKRELDGEYTCTGVTEGMGKFFGMLGSFQLVDDKGQTFSCGSGDLTVADRQAFWKNPPIGSKLQVRYPYTSADGIPQCPQFVRVRNDPAI